MYPLLPKSSMVTVMYPVGIVHHCQKVSGEQFVCPPLPKSGGGTVDVPTTAKRWAEAWFMCPPRTKGG